MPQFIGGIGLSAEPGFGRRAVESRSFTASTQIPSIVKVVGTEFRNWQSHRPRDAIDTSKTALGHNLRTCHSVR